MEYHNHKQVLMKILYLGTRKEILEKCYQMGFEIVYSLVIEGSNSEVFLKQKGYHYDIIHKENKDQMLKKLLEYEYHIAVSCGFPYITDGFNKYLVYLAERIVNKYLIQEYINEKAGKVLICSNFWIIVKTLDGIIKIHREESWNNMTEGIQFV